MSNVCAIKGCPALRTADSYVCAAHKHEIDSSSRGQLQPRTHKFNAQPTVVDEIRFDSKSESERYAELKLLEKGGAIRDLKLQTRWPLEVNGFKIGDYISDFDYIGSDGVHVIEDRKGYRTPLFKWKCRHFQAQYQMRITLT